MSYNDYGKSWIHKFTIKLHLKYIIANINEFRKNVRSIEYLQKLASYLKMY